ncbi:ion transport peptide-like [Penaeus japonicus]|uniref:ion transport peptide-like n=1 Tax=Penaeus japonicus TaxID=27405 RepID=UPI001C715D9A|nr:ion transport peptide-like [Penaeus japonicus]
MTRVQIVAEESAIRVSPGYMAAEGEQNRSLHSVARRRVVLVCMVLLLCQVSSDAVSGCEDGGCFCCLLCVSCYSCIVYECRGSFIKLRPNTLREFQYLQCRGEYNRERYAALSRVCDDCHNLFRQPQVMTECKSNCFQNSFFFSCVNLLKLEHLEDDFKNNLEIVSGNATA